MRGTMLRLRVLTVSLAAAVAFAGVHPVWAQQTPITTADIARLEAMSADIQKQADTLKATDATLAADVSRTLADINDDITYLKVKLRREGAVPREDYTSVRDRLENLRIRATGRRVTAQPSLEEPGSIVTVPVGTQFDVRLQTHLNSGTATIEQRFEATTILDYSVEGRVVIPAGTIVRGFVSSVRAAGRVDRKGSITLSFDEMRLDNKSMRLRASVLQALDGKVSEDAARIGVGAIAGAIIGGVFGGGKGALLGVLVGGGGTMAATEGTDVDLPVGTILRIRIDQPLDVPGR
jgi:hypothetical protein